MVMKWGMVMIASVASCGGGARTQSQPGSWSAPKQKSERTVDRWTIDDENKFIAIACTNIVVDGAFRCPSIGKIGLSPTSCVESFDRLRASVSDAQRVTFRLVVAGLGLASTCDEVDATFRIAAQQAQSSAVETACRRRDGSIKLSGEDMLRRRGLGDRVFGETPSSPDEPIEVCGVRGETRWLTLLTCADGSRPWGRDLEKAHSARTGSQPGTSKCDGEVMMIDHYVVPCPERKYDVYMNMYHCGPDEPLWPE
jgi:hypothetical protein